MSVAAAIFMLSSVCRRLDGERGLLLRRARKRRQVDMRDELPRAGFPRARQREGAAGFARHVERAEARRAQIVVEHAHRRGRRPRRADPSPGRPRLERRRRAPQAAPRRRCRFCSGTRTRRRRRDALRARGLFSRPRNVAAGKRWRSSASCGPSPITTLVPGKSSERNASMFFSTATRPMLTKIGRGRSRAAARSGLEHVGIDAAAPHAEIAEAAARQLAPSATASTPS